MRRITVSPSRSSYRHSDSDSYSYSDENSVDDAAEVEAALSALDNEFDQTEDVLTEWSRGSSVTPSSYLSGSATSPTFTTTDSSYIPFTNTLRDARILSTITERTENPSSRPTSHLISTGGSRPTSEALRRSTVGLSSSHLRGATEPGPGDRPTPPQGRRAGDLIAFFEDKTGSASPSLLGAHTRTTSAPSGPRSPSPYTTSQSMPTFTGATSYGYSSRPSSPTKSWTTHTSSSLAQSRPSVVSPPLRGSASVTNTYTDTFTPSTFTPTNSS
ncbi:hypothetical protein FA95DRAFT_1468238, partial [Auriscalpium vulgare]